MNATERGASESTDRLISWKDIAAYFGRDIRTVRRWEADEGLPVHRLVHGKASSVYASRRELDDWLAARSAARSLTSLRLSRVRWFVPGLAVVTASVVALVVILTPWMMNAPGSDVWEVRELEAAAGQSLEPALSPDGRQIAYSWNGAKEENFDIYVRLTAGGPPLRLTYDAAIEYSPAWSPDGGRIAFLRGTGAGRGRIVVVPALSGPEQSSGEFLTQVWPVGFAPGPHLQWSPDGRWLIVAMRQDERGPLRLARVSPSSWEMQAITNPVYPDRGDTGGDVSPDGRLLAYCRHVSWGNADLHVMPLTSDCLPAGPTRRIETGAPWNVSPAWLPGGDRVVLSHGTLFSHRLVSVPISGGSAAPLSGLTGHASFPSAVRVGARDLLVYTRRIEVANLWRRQISRSESARGSSKLRFLASTGRDFNPQYSPDGRRIVFMSDRTGRPEIWVCDADGSNAVVWTDSPGETLGAPEWSPDGSRLAYTADAGKRMRVLIVAAPGAQPKELYSATGSIWNLTWSPDGEWIYFGSDRPLGVVRIPAAGGASALVAEGARSITFTPDGRFRFFVRAGQHADQLWTGPTNGGGRMVLESFGYAEFGRSGFYYNSYRAGEDYHVPTCVFFRPYTSDVAEPLFCLDTGIRFRFAVSPDEKFVLYSRPEFEAANLIFATRSSR